MNFPFGTIKGYFASSDLIS